MSVIEAQEFVPRVNSAVLGIPSLRCSSAPYRELLRFNWTLCQTISIFLLGFRLERKKPRSGWWERNDRSMKEIRIRGFPRKYRYRIDFDSVAYISRQWSRNERKGFVGDKKQKLSSGSFVAITTHVACLPADVIARYLVFLSSPPPL